MTEMESRIEAKIYILKIYIKTMDACLEADPGNRYFEGCRNAYCESITLLEDLLKIDRNKELPFPKLFKL